MGHFKAMTLNTKYYLLYPNVVLSCQNSSSRWDLQHIRAMQAHQTLEKKCRDREEARLKGKKSGCKDMSAKCIGSFLPVPEDGQ